jgi:pre-60S factor REI1
MPPVSAEIFQQKVLAQRAQQTAPSTRGLDHLKANKKRVKQKNVENTAKQNIDQEQLQVTHTYTDKNADLTSSDPEIESETEAEPLELTECLFCPHDSVDIDAKMRHMAHSHSFFIPDVEYLVDLKGLINYLGWKVGVGNVCLYCSVGDKGHQYPSVEATQQHMRDKSHCKICYDDTNSDEYVDFYDYTSSYPDDSTESDEVPSMTIAVAKDGFELMLPSGATAGHRSLRQYYKQHLPVKQTPLKRKRNVQVDRLIAQYRGLGWHGDFLPMRQEFIRAQMEKQRKMKKDRTRLGVKANKLQHHFRPQVVF